MTIDADLAKKLWSAADEMWTNSGLQPSEYSTPVLALIFLKYTESKFAAVEKALQGKTSRMEPRIENTIEIGYAQFLSPKGAATYQPGATRRESGNIKLKSPERAPHMERPFRAIFISIFKTQCDALGWYVKPLRGYELFNEAIEPQPLLCSVLYKNNHNLRQTRDLLLPGLISGEIDVEGLEISVDDK